MDIYQSIESSVDLMNIADKLMKAHRCNDAHLATIHLASVAKHKSRWNEAESYLLELRQRVDLKMQQQILLNLIDTVPEAMTKLKYII
jgi:prolyl-tRNA synthetase